MTRRDHVIGFQGLGDEGEILAELLSSRRSGSAASRALTDVYLTEDPPALNVTVDAAGLDPESLHVVLDGDVLAITGERRRPDESGRRVYHHAEIGWGRFERHLRLGVPVDPTAAVVEYERGLLRIALPLAKRRVVKRVLIGVRFPG